jgi:hypothetical protein
MQMWHQPTRAHCDYAFHMAIAWRNEDVWREIAAIVENKGITTRRELTVNALVACKIERTGIPASGV